LISLTGGCGDFSDLNGLSGDWLKGVSFGGLLPMKADIYSIKVDGTNLVRLTSDEKSLHPQFSPDGAKILFFSTPENALNSAGNSSLNLNIMNTDGSARESLVPNLRGYCASYSKDGSTIVYVSGSVHNSERTDTIYFLSLTSRARTRLLDGYSIADPQFSFDGKQVYFRVGGSGVVNGLYSVKIDGSDLHHCIPTNVVYFDCSPVDGKIVVESLVGVRGGREISVTNSEGVILNRLMYVDYPYFVLIGNSAPKFSPNGAMVVFSWLDIDSSNGSRTWLYEASVDGKTLVKLTDGDKASFSPDGSKIVYRHNVGWPWGVYVINVNGTNNRMLSDFNNGGIGDLSFSPDGTRIVFTVYKNCIVF
jgi:Tol biopolymer transport system component